MKKTALLLMVMLLSGTVFATNLYQNNNPFPQTAPQSMNNIYESEPAVIQHETKQEKKLWFRKNKNSKETVEYKQKELQTFPKEQQTDGSFYLLQ